MSGLKKEHGNRLLFDNVTFELRPGRRIALIGGNGAGKTTMMEIVVGVQEADAGSVHKPSDYVIGYLPQELTESWTGTVLDEVLGGASHLREMEEEIARTGELLGEFEHPNYEARLERFGSLQSRFEQMGGYQIEAEARRILGGLGFTTEAMDRPLSELSGGWQMRAALARLLLQKPDVLVLDEPTNHLDVDSVGWLEDQLNAFPGSLLFVSHDRDFIDAVAERVIEVEWAEGRDTTFATTLEIRAYDRARLLEDVSKTVSDHRLNIVRASTRTGDDRMSVIQIDVELGDVSQLQPVQAALRSLDSVYAAYRVMPKAERIRSEAADAD